MVALVVLPGMDGTSKLREEFVAALSPTIEATAISYPTDQPLGYPELESLVSSRLPVDRPYVLLGESFSGPIAISIAGSCPPGLQALILCGSFVHNPRPILGLLGRLPTLFPFQYVPVRLLSPMLLGRFTSAPLRAALQSALAGVSAATLRARVVAVLRADVSTALPKIRVPVLYLRATEDRLVPRSCADDVALGAPQTQVTDLAAPHFMLEATPAAAAAAVKEFVRALR
jgi:pimeloyl-ACP methyl ester carboxylesterase